MRLGIFSFKLKEEFDRVKVLHWGHFFFIFLATLVDLFSLGPSGVFFLKVFLILGVYYFIGQTKNNLNYSFWTFAFSLTFYFSLKFFSYNLGTIPSLLYFCSLLIILIEMYILSSPIYYPRVSWWEYDFRYRDDLKIKISINNESKDGRLTDLRRNAGCVVSFIEIEVGKSLDLETIETPFPVSLNCEVMSKRQYSVGRAYHYGVRFHFSNEEERKSFFDFKKFWNNERKIKIKSKLLREDD